MSDTARIVELADFALNGTPCFGWAGREAHKSDEAFLGSRWMAARTMMAMLDRLARAGKVNVDFPESQRSPDVPDGAKRSD